MSAIARRPDRTPLMRRDPVQLAQHFAASGYFKDASEMSQAVVKIVAGEEVGLGPMASMQGIHIIDGKPSHSANVLAALIKRSEKYDYKVLRSDDEVCELEFFEDGEPVGISKFTIERARKMKAKEYGKWVSLAETLRWRNSPEDMLFARTISRGHRKFAPDVTAGVPAYTPEDAPVDDEGEVIHVEAEVEQVPEAQETEIPAERLDDDRLDRLVQGYGIAGPLLGGHGPLDGLNILLGSLNHDGIEAEPGLDLREVMAGWSVELADAVLAAFEEAVDRADAEEAEEVDGEIVQDGEEAIGANG